MFKIKQYIFIEIRDCGIAGEWRNTLGSNMTLICKDGQLEGAYNSVIFKVRSNYPLSGRYTMAGPKKDVVILGWTVSWNNEKGNEQTATSWSGIYYPDNDGEIRTQFIISNYKERKDYWESARINHDEFVRIK